MLGNAAPQPCVVISQCKMFLDASVRLQKLNVVYWNCSNRIKYVFPWYSFYLNDRSNGQVTDRHDLNCLMFYSNN